MHPLDTSRPGEDAGLRGILETLTRLDKQITEVRATTGKFGQVNGTSDIVISGAAGDRIEIGHYPYASDQTDLAPQIRVWNAAGRLSVALNPYGTYFENQGADPTVIGYVWAAEHTSTGMRVRYTDPLDASTYDVTYGVNGYGTNITRGATLVHSELTFTRAGVDGIHLISGAVLNMAGPTGVNIDAGTLAGALALTTTQVKAPAVYTRTVTSGATVSVGSDGTLARVTSAKKYKAAIAKHDFGRTILDLEPKTWHDRNVMAAREEWDEWVQENPDEPAPEEPILREVPGLIAEDVVAAGLTHFVEYDDTTGAVEGLDYARLWIPLIPIARDHDRRIASLEQQIKTLLGAGAAATVSVTPTRK